MPAQKKSSCKVSHMSLILIKGGKIASPNSIVAADLLIEDEKITKIARGISVYGAETIDASGLLVLPGAIDSHVHFRAPEDTSREDFSTGTSSALAGGVTTIMDMPNYRNPPTTTIAAYKAKQQMAKNKARCDYILRFGASETNFAEAVQSGASQLKIFLTDTKSELGCTNDAAIRHFQSFPKDKPICVHAEDRHRIAEREKTHSLHHEIRDAKSAQVACEFALQEAGKLGRRIHICHVTTGLEIEMCRRYPNATYEITPNHLFLSAADCKNIPGAGKINPPLRDRCEQSALWHNINDDTIIASDHAPHFISHKLDGAPGFPGVGTMLPLMLNATHEKLLSIEHVVKMCSFNPAAAFSLKAKGSLLPAFDADIVLVDMKKKWKITAQNRLSKCGWTPFEGKEVRGKIERVYLRGRLAYDGESVLSKPGEGKEIA